MADEKFEINKTFVQVCAEKKIPITPELEEAGRLVTENRIKDHLKKQAAQEEKDRKARNKLILGLFVSAICSIGSLIYAFFEELSGPAAQFIINNFLGK